jgi:heme a synthase
MSKLYKNAVSLTLLLTLVLVMMGAWVRLTDAGLGCPDWPGCYGKLTPTQAKDEINRAVAQQGGEHGPVSLGKAWREMLHRYLASFVGLLIVGIAVLAFKQRNAIKSALLPRPWLLPVWLVFVVVIQGLFGMWTVTLNLRPIIVTTHLMGGMLTFSLLAWLINRQLNGTKAALRAVDYEPIARLRPLALIALSVVVLQIFLGGWTSTNYAALACNDLPLCHGKLVPDVNFSQGFTLFRELGVDPAGNPLTFPALTAIHLTHRVGAIVTFIIVGLCSYRVVTAGQAGLGGLIGLALLIQVLLGLSNVWFSLPLPVAVMHNGGAAVLLGLLVTLNYRVYHATKRV